MKSILLTTTALVMLAGAAAAEVSFGGDFALGFNDDNDSDDTVVIGDNDGFYWEGDLNVVGTMELDNGVTAGAAFEFDIADETNGQVTVSDSVVLSLTTEDAGLFLGDTAFAAETQWTAAGDMEADGFSEQDGENVLRGDLSYGGIDMSISMVLTDADGNRVSEASEEDYDQLSFGASGDFGSFNFAVAYQEEGLGVGNNGLLLDDFVVYNADGANGDFNDSEIFGVSAGTTFAGASVRVAYAENTTIDESSLGVQVSYPFGPVTATVYYVAEDDGGDEDNYGATVAYSDGPITVALDYDYDQGVNKVGLDGAYNVGNGLTVLAGVYDQSDDAAAANNGTDYYVAGSYDLGGGAELLVSYADTETGGAIADDEVGAPDYQVGTTVELSFSF